MKKTTGRRTAAELMAELQRDPAFLERQAEQLRIQEANSEEYRAAAQGVLVALAEVGFPVETVGQLVHKRVDYREASGVLLDWLPRIANPQVKQDIVHALAARWTPRAKATRVLLDEFVKESATGALKWAIGDALEKVGDPAATSELLTLALDAKHGTARQMIVLALGRMRADESVVEGLIRLLEDKDVAAHAAAALGKLRAPQARPHLERVAACAQGPLVREAKRALQRL